ncbi:hypothetical protein AX16_007593 [Volvariella volvacea WC 439]|nr:hypothetical protein AX16_007593 [Volvariella volvacea WC 439]
MSTSQLSQTLSPQLQAQIADVDADIAELEAQIVQLRRRRNALMPISTIPHGLVAKILKLVVNNCCMPAHSEPLSFGWIKFTHIYSYWRDVALACPALWSFIHTANKEVFEAFLKRSKNHPLCIYIKPTTAYIDNGTNSRLVLAISNIHRIRCLSLPSSHIYCNPLKFDGIQAPLLEFLRIFDFGECTPQYARCKNISPMLAPHLRQLEMSGKITGLIWRRLLAEDLPSISNVTLGYFDYQGERDVLSRCKYLKVLRILESQSHLPTSSNPRPILLPCLLCIRLDNAHWPTLRSLILPSVRHVEIATVVSNNSELRRLSNQLSELLNPESGPLRNVVSTPSPQYSHLPFFVACSLGETVAFRLKDQSGNALVTLDISIKVWNDHVTPAFVDALSSFMQIVQTGIRSFDIEGPRDWRTVYYGELQYCLQACKDIQTVNVRGESGLLHFVNSSGLRRPHAELEVFRFYDVDDDQVSVFDLKSSWYLLSCWFEERQRWSRGLGKLIITHNQVQHMTPQLLERIQKAVTKLVVKDR